MQPDSTPSTASCHALDIPPTAADGATLNKTFRRLPSALLWMHQAQQPVTKLLCTAVRERKNCTFLGGGGGIKLAARKDAIC